MECKLCFKQFCNGKALGGHMRTHYAALPLPPKTPQRHELKETCAEKPLVSISYYGSKEKPKKSMRLVDPMFTVVDRESEYESTRSRSKKAKLMSFQDEEVINKGFLQKPSEFEMVNGEDDVAMCLIMLSRDVWGSGGESTRRRVYKCEECKKGFKSSQGLGSHRTSHYNKKMKNNSELRKAKIVEGQVHECPFCGKIFNSAQAVGGHKRSHFLASKFGESLVAINISVTSIDLDLPAPMEDEDEDEDEGEDEDEDENNIEVSISDA